MLIEVGRADDFPEGVPTRVHAGGRGLIVVRAGGTIYILRDVCPHQISSFVGGVVDGFATGTPEQPAFDADEPVIQCPWHRYEFSVKTGRCLTSDKLRVRTYRVTVEEGAVLVELSPRAEPTVATPSP
jgi:nitrite reductase (NADH) small subunit